MASEYKIRENLLKKRLKEGKVLTGCAVGLPHAPEVVRALASSGFDFLWFDMEHGQIGVETAAELSRVAVEAGITPLVRMRNDNPGLVTQMLDGGAQGIIFSRIENRKQAEEAVSFVKYPPQGKRGCDMKPFHRNYQSVNPSDFLREINQQTLVSFQIETSEGVKNAEQIVSVKGLDLIMVGPFDLSVSLGNPGCYETSGFEKQIIRVIKACGDKRITLGMLGDVTLSKKWITKGVRVVSIGSIETILVQSSKSLIQEIRTIR